MRRGTAGIRLPGADSHLISCSRVKGTGHSPYIPRKSNAGFTAFSQLLTSRQVRRHLYGGSAHTFVSWVMKRDGRGLDHRTLETIRLMAVERVRAGEGASSVISSYGFNRTTIYKWIKAASKPGAGLKALRSKPATGRPRTLTPRQQQQVFGWVNGKDPRTYGLDFGLWTRSVVPSGIRHTDGHLSN